jgi:NADP-dependent 3-hydroxy acid dehydrogenase YdfG
MTADARTPDTDRPTAVVTGASAGIGEAAARLLASDGWHVVVGARRTERVEALAGEISGTAAHLDVSDPTSVDRFCASVDRCRLLVNNAGGALGLEPLAEAVDEHWIAMLGTNVLGLMRMTRALLPRLIDSGDGHIVNVTSIAGIQGYPGGSGYNAAKFGAHGVTESLRHELLGMPVRVTEILPGMVETEFSVVRFAGDRERADAVYAGLTPLSAGDVGECIRWVASLPAHVNVDSIVVKPRDQADALRSHRGPVKGAWQGPVD